MNIATILSHFSTPNWPLVNKLGMISTCLELNRVHCSSLEKLRAVIAGPIQPKTLLFTDEGLVDVIQELDPELKKKNLEVAMLLHSPLPAVASRIATLKSIKYLIGGPAPVAGGRDLSILIKKFADGNILDLNKYLAFGSKIHDKIVRDGRSKSETVRAVGTYISRLGDPGYAHPYHEYSRIVCELTEELLLNAVFGANPRLHKADRSQPFHLQDGEAVHVAWGYDGEYFGISVRDPFGNFKCETVMNYLSARPKAESLSESSSAGLGLKLIFDRAHQIVTNVQREQVTEVIALVKFGARMIEFEQQSKSFYFFGDHGG